MNDCDVDQSCEENWRFRTDFLKCSAFLQIKSSNSDGWSFSGLWYSLDRTSCTSSWKSMTSWVKWQFRKQNYQNKESREDATQHWLRPSRNLLTDYAPFVCVVSKLWFSRRKIEKYEKCVSLVFIYFWVILCTLVCKWCCKDKFPFLRLRRHI